VYHGHLQLDSMSNFWLVKVNPMSAYRFRGWVDYVAPIACVCGISNCLRESYRRAAHDRNNKATERFIRESGAGLVQPLAHPCVPPTIRTYRLITATAPYRIPFGFVSPQPIVALLTWEPPVMQ